MDEAAVWQGARRVEAWAGEIRINLIRLVAIVLLYGNHLVTFYVTKADTDAKFHLAATALVVAWTVGSLGLHALLLRRWRPSALGPIVAASDAVMITTMLLLGGGPKSALLPVYFLLIASSALRAAVPAVWTATGAALAGWLVLLGHAKWVQPDWAIPRHQQIIFGIALLCAGLLAGQAVRQSARLALDYADRLKPDPPDGEAA